MTTKIELSKLFDEWENAVPDYKGKFVRDGIINEQLFHKAKTKILFVAKEPNDPNQTSWNLAEVLNQNCSGNFAKRLAEWAYGILNDFPTLNSLTDYQALHQALKSTSILNLKKIGGSSQSKTKEIMHHSEQNKTLLLKQIKLISPNIIVGGVGYAKIWEDLFGKVELKLSGYDIRISRWYETKIIDFYHPSYRVPRAMSYSLLQNVMRSKAFNEL